MMASIFFITIAAIFAYLTALNYEINPKSPTIILGVLYVFVFCCLFILSLLGIMP